MEASSVIEVSREAIFVLIKVSAPILAIALAVGLIISLLQALTQMQEATLSFVPKILTLFVCLAFLAPYMMDTLSVLFAHIMERIANP